MRFELTITVSASFSFVLSTSLCADSVGRVRASLCVHALRHSQRTQPMQPYYTIFFYLPERAFLLTKGHAKRWVARGTRHLASIRRGWPSHFHHVLRERVPFR